MSKISNKENNENIGVSPRKTARLSTNKENTNECSKVERVRKILGLSTNKLQDVKDDVDDTATSKSTKTDDVISKEEEEQSSTKSIDDEKIKELKQRIYDYYDVIKTKINLHSQNIQVRIANDNKYKNHPNVIEYKNLIIKLNEKFCKEIDTIVEENIQQIDKLNSNQLDEFQIVDLDKKGFYFDNKHMSSMLKPKYPIGALIVANWHLSSNDLRCLFVYFSQGDLTDIFDLFQTKSMISLKLDSDLINIFKENVKNQTFNENDNIIRLNKQELLQELKSKKELTIYTGGPAFCNYQFTKLCENAFEKIGDSLEQLSILNITNKNFSIHRNSFQGLTNLKELTLYLNKTYEQFDSSILNFECTPNLEKLSFTKLRTNYLKSDWLSSLSKLKDFELSESLVRKMDSDFFHKMGSRLESLSLRKLVIVYGYKDLFKEMSNLKSLDFILTTIDTSSNMKKEKFIDLNKQVLNYMPKLSKLEIDWSDFETIYEKLSDITDLNLLFNQAPPGNQDELIEKIDKKYFSKMKNLKAIKFEFDSDVADLGLILSNKLFRSFEKQCQQIETIEVNNGFECEVRPNAFTSFKNLKMLKMSGFELNHLESGVFDGLHNLEHLDLNSNCIKKIDSNVFSDLNNLKILNLSHNEIDNKCLLPKMFEKIAKTLEKLDLTRNQYEIKDLESFKTNFGFNSNIEIINEQKNKIKLDNVNVKKIMLMQKLFDNESDHEDEDDEDEDDENISVIDFYLASSSEDENDDSCTIDETNAESMFYRNLYHDSNGSSDNSF